MEIFKRRFGGAMRVQRKGTVEKYGPEIDAQPFERWKGLRNRMKVLY